MMKRFKTRKTGHILFVCIAMSAFPALSYAERIKDVSKPLYCSSFSTVDRVVVNYKNSVPNVDLNWKEVLREGLEDSKAILEQGHIPLSILEGVDTIDPSSSTLNLDVTYSYADKHSFSIPLENDVIAISVRAYFKTLNDAGERSVKVVARENKLVSKVNLDDYINPEMLEHALSSYTKGLTEKISCNVIRHAASKQCSDYENISKNKIVDVSPCVSGVPQEATETLRTFELLKEKSGEGAESY